MAEPRLPDEAVIRQLVERALEAVEAGAAPAAGGRSRGRAPRPSPATPAATPTPTPGGDARTVAIGADHGGYALKGVVATHLAGRATA